MMWAYDCILISQPVRAFDCVVHVPSPVVILHTEAEQSGTIPITAWNYLLSERSIDSTLRGNCMRPRRELGITVRGVAKTKERHIPT